MSWIIKASVAGALLAAALIGAGGAQAASPAVYIRVEGTSATLLPQTLVQTASAGKVKGNLCSGTSAAGALNLATAGNWSGSYDIKFKDYLVSSVLGETATGNDFWTLWINGRSSSTGACSTALHPGDHELWFDCLADPVTFNCSNNPLALRLPAVVRVGHAVTGLVTQLDGAGHSKPVGAGAVSGGGLAAVSRGTGAITLVPRRAGTLELQARKSGATPSDPVSVCVYRTARSECAVRGPAVHISGIHEHQVFRAGPRRLHGTASPDAAGLSDVSFSLLRHAAGARCSYFDAGRGAWRATSCKARIPRFSLGARATWSYLLPAPLPPGHYHLVVVASDANGRKGSSALGFSVKR